MNIGKLIDPQTHTPTDKLLQYEPADLTTHAVCVGMTGSGKTGLCLDLLEEAALAGLPSILIDPKGDIANLLLQFPELKPEDFAPWVNPDDARRAQLSLSEFAARQAAAWKAGLAQWNLGPEQIRQLKEAVDWAIYTPGSDAGRPVSILKSLEAPDLPWAENQEMLRERIAGLCAALLGLVGIEADPVKSREHILLANLFENAWKAGRSLDLANLITQVQAPPFPKLGVLDVETFYPQKDRMELALALNAIVAAPTFQAWITGEPLDIPALLYTPAGKPRCSIFYLAHLNDAERMFFSALLLEQLSTWLRGQSGTTSLRSLLYFDEVYGYLPPYPYNPPTKVPLMRLLKQARAFGLGVILVTQNPGDLDYKGLTNTGTWFVGKLQTERDRDRLLEGMETVFTTAHAAFNREHLDTLIASLAPRTFLLHNVHANEPVIFQTRWAMSYLAGPLTRDQIRTLCPKPASAPAAPPPAPAAASGAEPAPLPSIPGPLTLSTPAAAAPSAYSLTAMPCLPTTRPLAEAVAAWREASGNKRAQFSETAEMVYQPALLAQVIVRYISSKAGLNADRHFGFLLGAAQLDTHHWSDCARPPFDRAALRPATAQAAPALSAVPPALADARKLAALQKDLVAFLYRSADLTLQYNPALKLYSRPGQSYEEFRAACRQAAETRRAAEIDKLRARYDKKLDVLEGRLQTERLELKDDEAQLHAHEDESRWTTVENVLGFALGRSPRRAFSTASRKERLTEKAKATVTESQQLIASLQSQKDAVTAEASAAFQAVTQKWEAVTQNIQDLRLTPKRSDILVEFFNPVWVPHWQILADGQPIEIPAV